ncbi:hypothetical protein ACQ4PT_029015 [Festuca glaucescens]
MAIPTRLHPLFPTSAAPDSRAAPSSPASGAAPSAFVVADGGGCTYRGLPKVRVVEGCGSTVLPRPLLAALGQCVLSFGEDWEAELAARAAGRRSTGRRQPMSDQAGAPRRRRDRGRETEGGRQRTPPLAGGRQRAAPDEEVEGHAGEEEVAIARHWGWRRRILPAEDFSTPMLPSKFLHLKYLVITTAEFLFPATYHLFSLVSFLDASPCLETFDLDVRMRQEKHDLIFADPSKLEGIPGHCYGNLRRVRITGFCSRKMLVKLTCHILENTPSLECLTLDIAPDTIGQVRSTDDPIKVFSEVPLGKCGYPNLHRGKSSLHF